MTAKGFSTLFINSLLDNWIALHYEFNCKRLTTGIFLVSYKVWEACSSSVSDCGHFAPSYGSNIHCITQRGNSVFLLYEKIINNNYSWHWFWHNDPRSQPRKKLSVIKLVEVEPLAVALLACHACPHRIRSKRYPLRTSVFDLRSMSRLWQTVQMSALMVKYIYIYGECMHELHTLKIPTVILQRNVIKAGCTEAVWRMLSSHAQHKNAVVPSLKPIENVEFIYCDVYMPSQDVRTNIKRSYYASERNNVLSCTRMWAILTAYSLITWQSFTAVVTWFCCPAKKDGCPPVLWESQLKHSERSGTKRAARVFGQMRRKQGIEHVNL